MDSGVFHSMSICCLRSWVTDINYIFIKNKTNSEKIKDNRSYHHLFIYKYKI